MLPSKVIDYRELIARLTTGFVGRQWVRDALADFLRTDGQRYFLLLGEPGSGKSSFLADLVKHHAYPHHFVGRGSRLDVEGSLAWRRPVRMAESIGYQLVRDYGGWVMSWEDWGINASVVQKVKQVDGLLVGAHLDQMDACARPAVRPDLTVEQEIERFGPAGQVIGVYIQKIRMNVEEVVSQLLLKPLKKVAERWPDSQIVVVIDGLDEADGTGDGSIVGWLHGGDLPPTVRFVLSSRPGEHLAALTGLARILWLSEDQRGERDPRALDDARAYLESLFNEEALRAILAAAKPTAETLREKVALASRANFLYLHHYAQGLRAGDERLLNAKAVPKGLYGIYEHFLVTINDRAERAKDVPWTGGYKPVLGTLAVAREPLTQRQLAEFAGVDRNAVGSIVSRVGQFLEILRDREPRYSLYHSSFGEFLTSEQNTNYIDGQEAHRRIANHFLEAWGGLGALTVLNDPARRVREQQYGLRHVVDHLAAAGDWASIKQLVATFLPGHAGPVQQPWADAWFAAEGHYGGYLKDLERLWDRVETEGDVGTAVSAALIASSIGSRSAQLSPRVLVGLVKVGTTAGRWSPSAVLQHASLYVDAGARAETILGLLDAGVDLPWQEALSFIAGMGSPTECARVLGAVARSVPDSHVQQTIAVIRTTLDGSLGEEPLAILIHHTTALGTASRSALLDAVRGLKADVRVRLLACLADRGPEQDRSSLYREALHVLGEMPGEERLVALAGLAAQLTVPLLDIADELARTAGPVEATAPVQLILAGRRDAASREDRATALLHELTAATSFEPRCRALLEVRNHLAAHLRDEADRELAASLAAHAGNREPGYLLIEAVARVGTPCVPPLLAAVRREKSATMVYFWVKELVARLVPPADLAGELARAVLERPEDHAQAKQAQVWSMALLAPRLPEEWLGKGLRLAADLPKWDTSSLQTLLSALGPHLPLDKAAEAYGLVKRLKHDNDLTECLAALIPRLPERLLEEAMRDTEELHWSEYHPRALAAFRGRLSEADFQAAVGRSVAAADSMNLALADYLAGIAPLVTREVLLTVLGYAHRPAATRKGPVMVDVFARSLPESLLPDLVAYTAQGDDVLLHLEVLRTATLRCGDDFRQKHVREFSDACARYLARVTEEGGQWPGVEFFKNHAELIPEAQVMCAWEVARSGAAGAESAASLEALVHRLPACDQPRGYGQIVDAAVRIRDRGQVLGLALELVNRLPERGSLLEAHVRELASTWCETALGTSWSDTLAILKILEKLDSLPAQTTPGHSRRTGWPPEDLELDLRKCHADVQRIHWLSQEEREERCGEWLGRIRFIRPAGDRLRFLWDLLDTAGGSCRERVLEAMLETQEQLTRDERLRALSALAPLLPAGLRGRAATSAAALAPFVDLEDWQALMGKLACGLPDPCRDEVYHGVLRRLSHETPEGPSALRWLAALIAFAPDAVGREVERLPPPDLLYRRRSPLSREQVRGASPECRPTLEYTLRLPDCADRVVALTQIAETLVAGATIRLWQFVLRADDCLSAIPEDLGVRRRLLRVLPPARSLGAVSRWLGRSRLGRAILGLWRPADADLCRLWSRCRRLPEAGGPADAEARSPGRSEPQVRLRLLAGGAPDTRGEWYLQLALDLPESALPDLLESFTQNRDPGMSWWRGLTKDQATELLVRLARRVAVNVLPRVVAATLDVLYDGLASWPVLLEVARRLPDDQRQSCAADALRRIAGERLGAPHVAPVLILLGPFIPDELLQQALEVSEHVHSMSAGVDCEWQPIDPYLALAFGRTGAAATLVHRAAIRRFGKRPGECGADTWDGLLRMLPPEFLREAHESVRQCPDQEITERTLAEMARRAPEAELCSVFAAAGEVFHSDHRRRARIFALLAERGPETLLLPLLKAVTAIPDADAKSHVLKPLASHLVTVRAMNPEAATVHGAACLAAVRRIATYGRPDLIGSLEAMCPWVAALGSEDAAALIAKTLLAVAERWE